MEVVMEFCRTMAPEISPFVLSMRLHSLLLDSHAQPVTGPRRGLQLMSHRLMLPMTLVTLMYISWGNNLLPQVSCLDRFQATAVLETALLTEGQHGIPPPLLGADPLMTFDLRTCP